MVKMKTLLLVCIDSLVKAEGGKWKMGVSGESVTEGSIWRATFWECSTWQTPCQVFQIQ